jgi:hypothetical protein
MPTAHISAEQWLNREDAVAREGRLSRLIWIATQYPPINYQLFHGGILSHYLFEEARYCFVYGQFLATIMLGLAFIERTFAAEFFASGRNDLERASISRLLREMLECGWISYTDFEQLERARRSRNRVVHFRRPDHPDEIEWRSVQEQEHPYTLIEEDARNVLAIIFKLLEAWPFSV